MTNDPKTPETKPAPDLIPNPVTGRGTVLRVLIHGETVWEPGMSSDEVRDRVRDVVQGGTWSDQL